jgi:hypothetical protein
VINSYSCGISIDGRYTSNYHISYDLENPDISEFVPNTEVIWLSELSIFSVPDEGYSRNLLYALNLISTFYYIFIPSKKIKFFVTATMYLLFSEKYNCYLTCRDHDTLQTLYPQWSIIRSTCAQSLSSRYDLHARWLIDWLINWGFNATFSNISAISWRPLLVVEQARIPVENHRPKTKANFPQTQITLIYFGYLV